MMTDSSRWLLPEGIVEVLPEQAKRVESLRRQLLDLYRSWGYELVIPPFIEYLESLLTGTGNDLDLQTFKLTDQLNGRMMGVRADMTPQIARIEAHTLKRDVPTRLCYLGTVLRTRPLELGGPRGPLQVGAELYGHRGAQSDVEVITLMVESLDTVGVKDILVDLGHVGIFRALSKEVGLNEAQEGDLFDILQRKSVPELNDFLVDLDASDMNKSRLAALCNLSGGEEVLSDATELFQDCGEAVLPALDELKQVAELLRTRLPALEIHYDLAELRGYRYHTGVVFAAYSTGRGQAVAQGGRYDDIGGEHRPATGFSADLKQLIQLSGEEVSSYSKAVLAPWSDDESLQVMVKQLRAQGERVIQLLPGQKGDGKAMGCDRELIMQEQRWQVVPLA
jgi:ATP phosphoribosyltransferase regulatory subunit